MISFQPRPKIPPIGFFQPISVDPKDMMTDVEFLLGVLKKLNEVIAQTNKNTEFIDEYSGKIEEIEAEIAALRTEYEEFTTQVSEEIALEFAQIKLQLQSMISVALTQANAYTDAVAGQLRYEISQISLGQITVFDPTTGINSPLQIVIDNLYSAGRDNALTATEYDGLDLTATTYDGYLISAYDYDQNGKAILMP